MKRYIYILFLVVSFVSCEKEYEKYDVNLPSFNSDSIIGDTKPLTDAEGKNMEGIYTVTAGNDLFGSNLVFKYINGSITAFGEKDGIYAVLQAGKIDSLIVLEGYWRQANTGNTDLCRFLIGTASGSKQILTSTNLNTLSYSGVYLNNGDTKKIDVHISQLIKPESSRQKLAVLAHRAGGRTADRMHVSENSVEMVLYTEHLGSQGIEIDIQLTKDSIPVVFHDNALDIRLLQKSPVMGSISDYTFEQLSSLVRLYHGEKLPSLEELLNAVVEKTHLKYVWLDIKEPSVMRKVQPIQERAMQKATALGRDLYILQGLPTDDMIDAYMQEPDYKTSLSLCELTMDDVRKTYSTVWAPRWTRGISDSDVQTMHSEGKFVFVWTLDGNDFIKEYVTTKPFDGILTNYPTIVCYHYYMNNAQGFSN